MTVTELKALLDKLPGTLKVHTGEDGNDEAVRFVSLSGDTILICANSDGALPGETVLYDATPEGGIRWMLS